MTERLKGTNNDKLLNHDLAQKISSCVQELPNNTTINALLFWRYNPFALPAWTCLMLQLSTEQKKQLGVVLGIVVRSVPIDEELTLGRLATSFSLNPARYFNDSRRAFFAEAFQNPREEKEFQTIDLNQLKEQLIKHGLIRDETEPKKQQTPRMRKPKTIRVPTLKEKEMTGIESELWRYAVENDLLGKMVESGRVSPVELEQLEQHFNGKTSKPIPEILMDKFSIEVARFA